jgi:hypothetical protein
VIVAWAWEDDGGQFDTDQIRLALKTCMDADTAASRFARHAKSATRPARALRQTFNDLGDFFATSNDETLSRTERKQFSDPLIAAANGRPLGRDTFDDMSGVSPRPESCASRRGT